MSSEVAVRLRGVGKVYPIYAQPHHRLLQMFARSGRKLYREFAALHGIDFEVRRGETVGIVGRNGSGKSTLLQIVCGTLAPSEGQVEVHGRIAALLELGAGFNPEFSGRENVYINGAVLGLTRAEIDARFDEIAAFADIGEFIEQPVKNYSSGMYVRLGFAVAVAVQPDILIVDEALAVGDEAFQRKCYARIQSMREAGTTVLFVSHSAGLVTELCQRAVLLDRGEQLLVGTPKFVIARYHKLLYANGERAEEVRRQIRHEREDAEARALEPAARAPAPAADDEAAFYDPALVPASTVRYPAHGAHIDAVCLLTLDGQRVNVLRAGERYVYSYRVRFERAAYRVRCGMLIRSVSGLELGGGVTATAQEPLEQVEAGTDYEVRFEFRCLLAPGVYFVNAGVLGLVDAAEEYLDRQIDVAMFRVQPDPQRLATALVDFDVVPSMAALA